MICRRCGYKEALYQTEAGACNKCVDLTKAPPKPKGKKTGPKPKPKMARNLLIM